MQPALWLFSARANSEPSEITFSNQNCMHNKEWNGLSQQKDDMLAFVYYKSRALKRSLAMPVKFVFDQVIINMLVSRGRSADCRSASRLPG